MEIREHDNQPCVCSQEGEGMTKSIFLQTYGCQTNERDSEEVLGMLAAQGEAAEWSTTIEAVAVV